MKTETIEHPIIFSGAMVRALLDGRKTQTRRVIKPQPSAEWSPIVERYCPTKTDRHGEEFPGEEVFGAADENEGRLCPYGEPGDRLWVRETWRPGHVPSECVGPQDIRFAASVDEAEWAINTWRPSIFLPRWASRLTLEVVSVRVERLQEISEEDAGAEGINAHNHAAHWPNGDPGTMGDVARRNFSNLWDSINAKRGYGWQVNPWVWAISFKVVTP